MKLLYELFRWFSGRRPDTTIPENTPSDSTKAWKLIVSVLVLLIACGWTLYSGYYDLLWHQKFNLFPRSGAILVAAALHLEFQCKDMEILLLMEVEVLDEKAGDAIYNYADAVETFKKLGWVATLVGTFIWAYGDLVLSAHVSL